jgi:RimJ/RimL family protein N-acetyltransferase
VTNTLPDAADTRAIQSPVLEGRITRLRPIKAPDYEYLYDLFQRPDITFRWRFRGSTPSPESFIRTLWNGVHCQFLVESRDNPEPLGLVTSYNVDFHSQYAYIASIISPDATKGMFAMESGLLFVNYLFSGWNFRKLYGETSAKSLADFESGIGKYFAVEGILKDHEYSNGQYWDGYLVALYRQTWTERFARVADQLHASRNNARR